MGQNDNTKQKTYFEVVLRQKIEVKTMMKNMPQEFQDLHWDDSYDAYYDSSR